MNESNGKDVEELMYDLKDISQWIPFKVRFHKNLDFHQRLLAKTKEHVSSEYLDLFQKSLEYGLQNYVYLNDDFQRVSNVAYNMEECCFRLRNTNKELEKQLKALRDENNELKMKYNKQIEKELVEVSPRKTIDETLKDFSQAIQTLFNKIDEIQNKPESSKEKYV